MPSSDHILIFTDLDGTLLNQHDYRFEAVLPLVGKLQAAGTPVILSTSKTLPEVTAWQKKLGITAPFMIENGSAVYFPRKDYSQAALGTRAMDAGNWYCIPLGADIDTLRAVIAPFMPQLTTLVDCTVGQAMSLTGLTREEAVMAQTRGYTIPLVIEDLGIQAPLMEAARAAGLRLLQGGRFLHLQGDCDKGQALAIIRDTVATRLGGLCRTIALGDSENDLQMLEAADIPVVVNTDRGHKLKPKNSTTIYTDHVAPEGWVEGVETALEGDT